MLNLKPHLTTEDFLAQGWISIHPLEPISFKTPRIAATYDVCPQTRVKFDVFQKDYRYLSLLGHPVKVRETIHEAPLLFVAVIQYLALLIQEEKAITREYEGYTFTDPHIEAVRKQQVAFHLSLVNTYQENQSYLASYNGKGFRSSVMKKEEEVQFLAINCHVQELIVDEGNGNGLSCLLFFLLC